MEHAAVKALLFDMDGTIAETEDVHRRAFNRAFEQFGLPWHWDVLTYRQLLDTAGGLERMLAYAGDHTGTLKGCTGLDRLYEIHAWKTAEVARLMRDEGVDARPGVRRLVREATEAGVALALVTTSQPAVAQAVLRGALGDELADRFATVITGADVKRKKPAPDGYHVALGRLGLDAADCVAVEDSPIGLQAAQDAGLCCVVTESLYTEGSAFAGAAVVLDCLGEPGRPCDVRTGPPPAAGWADLAAFTAWCRGTGR